MAHSVCAVCNIKNGNNRAIHMQLHDIVYNSFEFKIIQLKFQLFSVYPFRHMTYNLHAYILDCDLQAL